MVDDPARRVAGLRFSLAKSRAVSRIPAQQFHGVVGNDFEGGLGGAMMGSSLATRYRVIVA